MEPKIISIGYCVPENSYTQDEIFDELRYPSAFKHVFTGAGIGKRHFWVPLDRIRKLGWQEQQEEYMRGAIALSKQAILNCLDGRSPKDIACIVFCSCTGFCPGPTIPHYLAKEFQFPSNTYLTNIGSMGCESGFPGLKRAYDFIVATGKPCLVITCELTSCTYFPEPEGKADSENHFELARSNAIFADAAVCALIGYDDDPRHPSIIDTETCTNTDYIDDLGFTWRQGRLRVLLSRRVPELAPLVVKPAVDAVLQRQELSIDDITWWVIHAAGNIVLDNIRDALGIEEKKLRLSRETLRMFGNTSSTSVGISGKSLMAEKIQPGDYAAVLSIGPGMTGGATLLRFER
ncbi:MAG TPA: 3-oxoacyl-[acyl-carrier-protein] synthase III C-terminal domain-containing protein [Dehalococcoidales bacterium]|nr:3-oxoacyl-[acyl-carrier-protein] synthase III C-terminal domain-containing protein [Dehalococcoidales bacterium]